MIRKFYAIILGVGGNDELSLSKCYKQITMSKYVVTQFGVDLKGNEIDEAIWEGEASNSETAIEKAISKLWPTDIEKREFMRLYMKATKFENN